MKGKENSKEFDYDLFVIGGGSGGLAMAKEAINIAAKNGTTIRVAIADYVKPTPKGTKWGLGGTCVNVGCIPKKLMHFAAQSGDNFPDAREAGWGLTGDLTHNWEQMKKNVSKYIYKLNWGYKAQLIDKDVMYYNKMASFVDANTILLAGDPAITVKAKTIVVAIGNRPNYSDLKGAHEYAITSDDLFWLEKSPGKTLVVGASYVALECAGFLTKIKCDVTLMVRSIFLRGFDQDMASRVGAYMEAHGTKILRPAIPLLLTKNANGKIDVLYKMTETNTEKTEQFDTVLLAIGRIPITKDLNLDKAGVKIAKNGKIITNELDQTNIPHIYAIGDVALGRPELTPVAIMAGKLLAHRVLNKAAERMDYTNIPSTVYTPLEYSCCGPSEETAQEKFGKDNVVVYHSSFKPLEWNFLESREADVCYTKVIVQSSTDKVLGFHYLGPNAGEVAQGYAMALKLGVTKKQWDSTVKIHPTCSEEMLALNVTKASGVNAVKSNC